MKLSTGRGALPLVLAIYLAAVGCSDTGDDAASTASETTTLTSAPTTASSVADATIPDEIDQRFDLPPEARTSNGEGDPRPPSYWAVWNSCAPDNRSAEAESNGGRAAGWVLVDDILADPGIDLGDHILTTCEESLALLQGRTGAGEATTAPIHDLAAELLAAELNLSAGSETCPAAEEAVVGAHIVLSSANFDGVSSSPLVAEAGGALPDLLDLLAAYNSGQLCR